MTHLVAFADGLGAAPEELPTSLGVLLETKFDELEAAFETEAVHRLSAAYASWLGARCAAEEGAASWVAESNWLEVERWLEALHFGDLFVAYGAGQSDADMVRRLRDGWVRPASRRIVSPENRAEELAASVLTHLVVRAGDVPPRTLSYSGRGPLAAWVHMVSRRKSMEMARGSKPLPASDAQEYLKKATTLLDPELDLLKFRAAKRFNEALELALRALPAGDANVLYLSGVKRVPLGAIATMEGVSVRTVQRRIGAIRARVFEDTKQRARDSMEVTDAEVSSLLALVQSQLDVTLHRVLAPKGAGESAD